MPVETTLIMQSLAPGLALSSMILYYGNLQSRLIFTTEMVRRLNQEARQLQPSSLRVNQERVESIRWQVEFLTQRFRSIRHAILLVYCGFVSLILTIMALLVGNSFHIDTLPTVGVATFALGFVFMGAATALSSGELALAQRTLAEDVRTSYDLEDLAPPKPVEVQSRVPLSLRR